MSFKCIFWCFELFYDAGVWWLPLSLWNIATQSCKGQLGTEKKTGAEYDTILRITQSATTGVSKFALSCFHLKCQVQTDQTKLHQVLIYLLRGRFPHFSWREISRKNLEISLQEKYGNFPPGKKLLLYATRMINSKNYSVCSNRCFNISNNHCCRLSNF